MNFCRKWSISGNSYKWLFILRFHFLNYLTLRSPLKYETKQNFENLMFDNGNEKEGTESDKYKSSVQYFSFRDQLEAIYEKEKFYLLHSINKIIHM